jgi:curved DNA-binding protein CbpA
MQTVDVSADSLYERLGLGIDASAEEIRGAYHRLLRIYPPERAPEEFKRIREAYETLKDPDSREAYNSQPDPKLRKWIDLGMAALGEKRYGEAEKYFKQVLIQAPDLAFARNYLGLSFLYQGKGMEAVAQYKRLIQTQPQDASLFGHLGHAYRMAGKMTDAERAFRRAIDFGDEDKAGYYLSLAELFLSQNEGIKAKDILEKGIRSDKRVDFEDLPLFTKLLEIELRKADLDGVNDVVNRIQAIVEDDEQGRYVAWKFGALAQSLVEAEGFKYALILSLAARRLMPADTDYHALVAVSEALDEKDLAAASDIVRAHPSFREGAWLSQLGPIVLKYCVKNKVLANLKPIKRAPSLQTINTIGFKLYGARDYDEATQSAVSTLYFVILFLPLFPLASYRVTPRGEGSWSFLGKVPFSDGESAHFWIVLLIAFIWILGGSTGSSGSPNSSSAPYTSGSTAATVPAAAIIPAPAPDPDWNSGSNSSVSPAVPERRSATKGWIEEERTRLVNERRSLDIDGARLDPIKSEIALSQARLRSLQSDSELGLDVDEFEYNRLQSRHNNLVREHNAILDDLRHRESLRSRNVDAFNQQVDLYNSRR